MNVAIIEHPPLCVNVKTAAAMIGVSAWMVRTYIDSGKLPTVKFPSRHEGEQSRRVLIAVEDLKLFIAQHRIGVPERIEVS